ncbi:MULTISPECIES: extracellular solute-binding protein [unclassified Amycolatopsis]|uniref:extracellular solute-binding protein n=1 Tax=unclassified Amycolatopsis TaxID=2618356 RepID=UPI002875C63B|nr:MULTISPECIES: extracellular solute-binding protein [unclassified Amycolatopsis]MDS0140722.1 extracellular solute-binding protein [Amycolatopsis sp. 505]MDS0149636.1 extracellular solute-binding protein [Amycolatopsis sp. CM201R]
MVRKLLAGTTTILLLAGCGGVGSGGDTEATLTTMGFGLGDEIATTRADLAGKAIAPATVKIGGSAFDAQQFLASVASHTPPDLVYLDRQLLGTYAARGTLEPLTDCIAKQHIDVSQYRPAALEEVTLDGKVYGLPEFYDNRVLLVNDAAVEAGGLTPRDVDPADRAKLTTAAQKLTVRSGGGLSRIGFDPKIPEFLPLWAKANGVQMLSDDGRTAHLDDPRLAEALTYAKSLIDAQGGWSAVKAFRDSFDFFGEKNPFKQGQLAATLMDDWYLNVLANYSPDVRISAAPFTDTAGTPIDWVTGSAWVIPAGSTHKEQACTWIKTMTDAPAWIAAAKARAEKRKAAGKAFTGVYTGNRVADQEIFGSLVQLADRPAFDAAVRTVLKAQDSAFTMPASPAGSEFKTAWQNAVNRVLSGEQQPADALRQGQQEAQRALDAAR